MEFKDFDQTGKSIAITVDKVTLHHFEKAQESGKLFMSISFPHATEAGKLMHQVKLSGLRKPAIIPALETVKAFLISKGTMSLPKSEALPTDFQVTAVDDNPQQEVAMTLLLEDEMADAFDTALTVGKFFVILAYEDGEDVVAHIMLEHFPPNDLYRCIEHLKGHVTEQILVPEAGGVSLRGSMTLGGSQEGAPVMKIEMGGTPNGGKVEEVKPEEVTGFMQPKTEDVLP